MELVAIGSLLVGFLLGVAFARRMLREDTAGVVREVAAKNEPESDTVEDYVVDRDGTKMTFMRPRKKPP